MRILQLRTPEEKMIGLQWRPYIEADALYVFHEIGPGDWFHSNNVPEPFDIAFLSADGRVLEVTCIYPPEDVIEAPAETALALEARAGNLAQWGVVNGSVVSLRP